VFYVVSIKLLVYEITEVIFDVLRLEWFTSPLPLLELRL